MFKFTLTSIFLILSLEQHAFAQNISSISPNTVAAGSSGFSLFISGSNFQANSVVVVTTPTGLTLSLTPTYVSSTFITATLYPTLLANPGNLQLNISSYGALASSNSVSLNISGSGSTSSGSNPTAPSNPASGSGSSSGGSSSGGSSGCYGCYSGSSTGGSSGTTPPPPVTPTATPTPQPTPAQSPSSGSTGSTSSGSDCYGCYSSSAGSTGTGSSSNPPPPPPTTPPSGSGKSTGTVTSAPTDPMLVTVNSVPSTVNGSINIVATATATSNTDGGVVYWAIFDSTNMLWIDINGDTSINVNLALSQGAHTINVVAYDDSYRASTAVLPITSSNSGIAVSWHACMYNNKGSQEQAMQISPIQTVTGQFQSQMFWGSNCNPIQWTDQMNDVGGTFTFGAGSEWTYFFIHRPDMPAVSAVWTIGNQSSGCVNYSAAPPCD